MIRLDGKLVAAARREALQTSIKSFTGKTGIIPGLAVILVGDNPASEVYVRNKAKTCKELGMNSWVHNLPAQSTANEVATAIEKLNRDKAVTGILIQLPLPPHLKAEELLDLVDPKKDPDCLTAENVGLFHLGRPRSSPCTPSGVMAILAHYKISVAGARALVIGRSHIVGQPMAQLLMNANATVTIAHSKTKNLKDLVKSSELVVVAMGKPEYFVAGDFATGAVIVDVGIHRLEQNGKTKIVGDVKQDDFANQKESTFKITPVPGGVGPMTIQMLMENTLRLAELG